MKLKLQQKLMLLVVLPTAVAVVFIFNLIYQLHQLEVEEARLEKARQTGAHMNRMLFRLIFSVGGVQGALLSRDEHFFGLGFGGNPEQDIIHELNETEALVKNDPELSTKLDKLKRECLAVEERLKSIRMIVKDRSTVEGIKETAIMQKILRRVFADALDIMESAQAITEKGPEIEAARRDEIQSGLINAMVATVAVALFIVVMMNRDIVKRLRTVSDNSVHLAIGKPLTPPVGGSDEIASLDREFRKMAELLAEATEKERALTENARDVICSLDNELRFVKVNAASLAVWGFTPEELLGQRFNQLLVEHDRDTARSAFDNLVKERHGDLELETQLRHKDGHVVDALWSAQYSPQARSIFCVVHDISERKQAERLKQEFVNMVSHDLRTPLTSVRGTLSLLVEGVYDSNSETGKNRLHLAQQNIDRLINLINDLLDIEKLEAGMLAMTFDDVMVSEVVNASIADVSGIAEQHKITITPRFNDMTMFADRDRLVQVVVNLLSNAIKFSPDRAQIDVVAEKQGDVVEISVVDHGRGIPKEAIDSVFDRFKQVQQSDGKHGAGTGLGLAICRAIVESHHGTIGVESEEGKGSRFWFRIPLARNEDDEDDAPLETAQEQPNVATTS